MVYAWRAESRYGVDCSPSLRGQCFIHGIEFPDEAAAARFDLDDVAIFTGGSGTGWLRSFPTWGEAEVWARDEG